MHCKHCGNQIENDSKFCAFCGGKIDPIGQTIPIQQPIIQTPPAPVSAVAQQISNNRDYQNHDKGFLITFCVMVGLRLFWFVSDLINKDKSYTDLEDYYKFVVKPTYIIFWCVPLLMALFSKSKEQRLIMLIISLCIIGWTIYENFIKSV